MTRKAIQLFLTLALAAALVGCSGNQKPGNSTSPSPSVSPSGTTDPIDKVEDGLDQAGDDIKDAVDDAKGRMGRMIEDGKVD